MSDHPDNAMICLGFFYICFHKTVVTVEGSFISNIWKNYLKNSLNGFFDKYTLGEVKMELGRITNFL